MKLQRVLGNDICYSETLFRVVQSRISKHFEICINYSKFDAGYCFSNERPIGPFEENGQLTKRTLSLRQFRVSVTRVTVVGISGRDISRTRHVCRACGLLINIIAAVLECTFAAVEMDNSIAA